MAKSILKRFPKLTISLLPTPLHKLEKVSEELSANVYCKRDDLTGFAFGGNKTRKLDFLIGDAIKRKADTLIAIGAKQSNFCRIAAATGIVNGFDVHLVLGGTKPEKPTGNLLLDHIFGAKIHYIDSDDWVVCEEKQRELMKNLTKQGRKVYCLPMGGSTPIGALGYVLAFYEIIDDSERTGISFDTIVLASSSGGTQAGLIAGKELTGWKGKIIGMAVAKDKEKLEEEIYNLACETGELVGTNIKKENVIIDDSYIGEKYGARTAQCEEAIKLFAQKEGILLDYVYTGKAAAGLIDYARRGLFDNNENVLFIHTGGNVELFE